MKPHKSTLVIHLLLLFFFLTIAGTFKLSAQTGDIDEEYTFLIGRADQFYDDQKLEKALYEYQKASNLKPDEQHPKTRIQQISQVLDVQKTNNILFEVAITSAEQFFAAGDYKRAKAEYESAIKLNPKAQFPKDRLQQISKIWSDPAVEAAYAAAIKKADALLANLVYLDAKGEYMTASDLKPHEQYPLDKILEINELLAAMKNAEEDYAKFIALADQLFDENRYEDSRANYVEATNVKPEERYPKDRIQMIDELVAQLTAQRNEYDALIALADQYYINQEFDKAKIEYKKAVKVMPDDSYANSMLEKIDPLIADLNQKKQDFELAIGNGDRLLAAADYEAAREQYQTASQLFPEDIYPKNKINEINTLMGDLAAQQIAYDEAIGRANQFYSDLDYIKAKQVYQEALDIKPGEQVPTNRIQAIDEMLAQTQATEDSYNAAISKGEALLEEAKYEEARIMFQEAMTYKPNETYPPEKISEINQILSQLQDIQYRYDESVSDGDKLFNDDKYTQAKLAYQGALKIKPDETYPTEKIDEIERILGERTTQQAYEGAIATAEKYFKNRDYENARLSFEQAGVLKPEETLPVQRIAEIDNILAQLELDDAYTTAIDNAEELHKEQDYSGAIAAFGKAYELKPDEQYPKDKIAQINDFLANKEANDKTFSDAILLADGFFASQEYENARSEYEKALNIYPGDEYVQKQLAEILEIQDQALAAQQKYDKAIAAGDKAFEKRDWEGALTQYGLASTIKPDEQYPIDQTTAIEKLLADMNALNEAYDNAIVAGDANFDNEKYDDAIANFQEAQNLKPFKKYPTDKIEEINQLLADLANKQQAFDDAIAAADEFYSNKEYSDALSQYERAANLKPEEEYPITKIEEISAILSNIREKQKAYDDAITSGDSYFKSEDWKNAKTQYQTALEAKPEETYPTDKLTEIDGILTVLLSQAEQYEGTITEADKLFSEKAYEQALASYNKAAGIKPDEQYPKTKIGEINNILDELAKQLKEYNSAIVDADKYFDKKDYDNARTGYLAAIEIKGDEEYPNNRITEIDQILSDIAATQKAYDDAVAAGDGFMTEKKYKEAKEQYEVAANTKPDEEYPKDQIATINTLLFDIKEIEENYASAISNGENYFNESDYESSLNSFQNAGRIKPEETYPKEKIDEINIILAGIAAREGYEESVAAADKYFREEDYDRAFGKYTSASEFKPEEQYPKDKIAEIESLFADIQAKQEGYDASLALADQAFEDKDYQSAINEYENAGEFKPDESYPKAQISKIEGILSGILATDQEYNKTIDLADKSFNEGIYEEALRSYQNAAKIKPAETYPGQKIEEINTILANLSATLEAYNSAIKDADNKLKDRAYEDALAAYQSAKSIKPDETYPDDKIAELLTIQKTYDDAISIADGKFDSKDYEAALASYQEALLVYPDESHPKNRIETLNGILANLRIQQEYDNTIAEADNYFDSKDYDNARNTYQNALNIKPEESYPQDQITEINNIMLANTQAREEAYDKAIASGDRFYNSEDYKNAKIQYQNALGMMADDQYAKSKLKEVEDILMAREIALRAVYQKAVAKADDLYNKRILDEAIEAYREAQAVKPDEAYPENMINEIRNYIQEHTILDITTTKVLITNNTDKKYDFAPIDYGKRKNNYILLKARIVGDKVPKLYLTYGRDGQKSGGIVLTKLREGDTNDYIIRVSAQDPWFRVDNNWMKLYSEGGDIEITSVQVSQGD
jgi:tetratricopeptide (TPR) repeat protein